MSSGGHSIDMVNRMIQNRAQRPSKRAKFKDNTNVRDRIYTKFSKENRKAPINKVSENELNEIKKKIRETANRTMKREQLLNGIIFGTIISALITLLIWMN